MSEGVPPHATESSEHLVVTGQPEVTSGTRSDMDTRAPGGKESRRADAAEMGERGTPPQRQLPGERTAVHVGPVAQRDRSLGPFLQHFFVM